MCDYYLLYLSDDVKERGNVAQEKLYIAGYNRCRDEVSAVLDSFEKVPDDLRSKLNQHLESQKLDEKSEAIKSKSDQHCEQLGKTLPEIKPKLDGKQVKEGAKMSSGSKIVSSSMQNPAVSGASVLVCNQTLPTYILVPTATLCQTIPVTQSQQPIHPLPFPVPNVGSISIASEGTKFMPSSLNNICAYPSVNNVQLGNLHTSSSSAKFTFTAPIFPSISAAQGSSFPSSSSDFDVNQESGCTDTMWRPW